MIRFVIYLLISSYMQLFSTVTINAVTQPAKKQKIKTNLNLNTDPRNIITIHEYDIKDGTDIFIFATNSNEWKIEWVGNTIKPDYTNLRPIDDQTQNIILNIINKDGDASQVINMTPYTPEIGIAGSTCVNCKTWMGKAKSDSNAIGYYITQNGTVVAKQIWGQLEKNKIPFELSASWGHVNLPRSAFYFSDMSIPNEKQSTYGYLKIKITHNVLKNNSFSFFSQPNSSILDDHYRFNHNNPRWFFPIELMPKYGYTELTYALGFFIKKYTVSIQLSQIPDPQQLSSN